MTAAVNPSGRDGRTPLRLVTDKPGNSPAVDVDGLPVAGLLDAARTAGLTVTVDSGGLVVRGPRRAEPLARALLARKTEVLALLAVAVPRLADGLDWSRHSVGDPRPCRLCRRPAMMRDAEGQPCHKTCAEQHAR